MAALREPTVPLRLTARQHGNLRALINSDIERIERWLKVQAMHNPEVDRQAQKELLVDMRAIKATVDKSIDRYFSARRVANAPR